MASLKSIDHFLLVNFSAKNVKLIQKIAKNIFSQGKQYGILIFLLVFPKFITFQD